MYRKQAFLASISLILVLLPNMSTKAAHPSLVGWWRLDEGAGSAAFDYSGYGNDGTLQGGTQWAIGVFSGAVQLDGIDDYVDIPHAQILTVDNEVTVMAWINTPRHEGPGGAGWQGILSKGNNPRSYSLYTVAATGVLHFSVGPGGAYVGTTSTGVVPLGEWVHVCAQVIDGQHQYYINGQDAGRSGSDAILLGTQDTANVVIGRTQEGTGRSFLGRIDDARIYNRALSQDEILVAMNVEGQPLAHTPAPPAGEIHEDTWVVLSWLPGDWAVSHDVYMGDNFDDVNDGLGGTYRGNQPSTTFVAGFAGFAYPDGLVPGTTYYWRIDEVNEADTNSPCKGDVWSFRVGERSRERGLDLGEVSIDSRIARDFLGTDAIRVRNPGTNYRPLSPLPVLSLEPVTDPDCRDILEQLINKYSLDGDVFYMKDIFVLKGPGVAAWVSRASGAFKMTKTHDGTSTQTSIDSMQALQLALDHVAGEQLVQLSDYEELDVLFVSTVKNTVVQVDVEAPSDGFVSDHYVGFGRRYRGVPIVGSKLILRLDGNGDVVMVQRNWRRIEQFGALEARVIDTQLEQLIATDPGLVENLPEKRISAEDIHIVSEHCGYLEAPVDFFQQQLRPGCQVAFRIGDRGDEALSQIVLSLESGVSRDQILGSQSYGQRP
jgi:hypothetical protein